LNTVLGVDKDESSSGQLLIKYWLSLVKVWSKTQSITGQALVKNLFKAGQRLVRRHSTTGKTRDWTGGGQ
jgi:hypothetical protein